MNLTYSRRYLLAAGISLFLGGMAVSWGVFVGIPSSETFGSRATVQTREKRESGYQLINPLLECEAFGNEGATQLSGLKKSIESQVAQYPNQQISVYYRDLQNGPWYGYREEEGFSPQSLLKMPVVLAYFKLAEENPDILNERIAYLEPIASNLPDESQLPVGQEYTVLELVKRTVVLSDNSAFRLLVDALPSKFLKKVHEDLGIAYPSEETPDDFVSVRSYSSIFRVLYNSSYLSRRNSEYVLSLLAESEFTDGLVAGVPPEVVVAHKFGIKNPEQTGDISQLHDCGVVYHPTRPYLLCIMTRGSDQARLQASITAISRSVFEQVSSESSPNE